METTETLTYRGILSREGSITIGSAWDASGDLVRFAGDWRIMANIPVGAEVKVESWAILGRAPAFTVEA